MVICLHQKYIFFKCKNLTLRNTKMKKKYQEFTTYVLTHKQHNGNYHLLCNIICNRLFLNNSKSISKHSKTLLTHKCILFRAFH